MPKRPKSHVPPDLLEAGKAIGKAAPLSYVGRSNGYDKVDMSHGAHEVILEGRRKGNVDSVPAVPEFPAEQPDRTEI